MDWQLWGNQLVEGVTLGSSIFLMAAGLTLIFGVLHILNFAHGSLYLLGAYLAVAVSTRFGGSTAGFVAGHHQRVHHGKREDG